MFVYAVAVRPCGKRSAFYPETQCVLYGNAVRSMQNHSVFYMETGLMDKITPEK
jgi:hypothetical protein